MNGYGQAELMSMMIGMQLDAKDMADCSELTMMTPSSNEVQTRIEIIDLQRLVM